MSTHRLCLITLSISLGLCAADTWRFVVVADWHSAEKYTQLKKNPSWLPDAIREDVDAIRAVQTRFGGDLVLLPGDCNGGHWDTAAFIRKFQPGLSPEETILQAGHLCYSGMVDSFRKGGYDNLVMAVGDHELGDNPWPPNSAVSRCQPQFRQAFANQLNRARDTGRFRFDARIGTAPARPLNTPYRDTSFAYRHRNVLFVTVDVFHQESPDRRIGDQGTVRGAVTGAHLAWLDQVLEEARRDPDIEHVFVQSHLPVIYPVRKVNSSGMMMDGGTETGFWQALREHRVDIYFAGEVHANTVTKDPESDLIQLVSRGNFLSNLLTVDVSEDRMVVRCWKQTGNRPSDGLYDPIGTLTVDKTAGTAAIQGTGELSPLDPAARLLHFDFGETKALVECPIVGLRGKTRDGKGATIREAVCRDVIPNRGELGPHYSALSCGITETAGPAGRAGSFTEKSRMAVFGMGPHHRGHAVSYALWVRTTASGDCILINSGSIWGKSLSGFLNLNLEDGTPVVQVAQKRKLEAPGVALNDGRWHHIAVTMPGDDCRLAEVRIFADGHAVDTQLEGDDGPLAFNQAVRLGIGSLGYSRSAFDKLGVAPFTGDLDEVSVWARPLTADEVQRLARRPK